jgi:two-component system response regulator MtrA
MATKILIVEDDAKIAELVAKNLTAIGLECRCCGDGSLALREVREFEPDLVILDIMLPGMDGLEIARRLRQKSKLPILMLTARASEGDLVLGFEVGADDYLSKPFSTRELVARVRALLRRAAYDPQAQTLRCGDLTIDPARREVLREEEPIELTSLEFDLLLVMASHPGRVYSRQALLGQVWGGDRIVDDRSIDSLVSRLRRKIEVDPAKPAYIQTVWGAGYRFVAVKS